MDWIKSILLGTGVGGLFLDFLISLVSPSFERWYKNKIRRVFNRNLNIILNSTPHKNFDNVILVDTAENTFSKIAKKFIKKPKNRSFIITNVQEPFWFYNKVEKHIHCRKPDHVELLQEFRSALTTNNPDYVAADGIIIKLLSNDDIFAHSKEIVNYKNNNKKVDKVRINYFKINMDNAKSITDFKSRNGIYHFYFFEKYINNGIESLYDSIDEDSEYRGTDALILNEEIILNYDSSIKELYYQNCSLKGKTENGFFHNVIEKYKKHKKENPEYKNTLDIFEKVYKNPVS